MDILNNFLQSEINSKEFFECITDFITSFEVRKGEFEGNEFIIMKVDRENFILFPEYESTQEGKYIPYALSIYKDKLLDAINIYAQKKGII